MLYLTALYCLLHTRKVQPFDDNEHRAIVGSCGHAICSECFQNLENSSCPLCQEENAFGRRVPNYTAIAMIEQRREDFWGALKLWWSGENYGKSLCIKCAKDETLRICLTCHQNKLCVFLGDELRLRMRHEYDLVILARHAICAGCLLDKHVEGHESIKIDDIKYSKKDIRMTTAGIILRLFRDGMRKKKGLIGCKLRHERVERTGRPLLMLLRQLEYTDEDECGYLGEQIKMELIKKYIYYIDKKLNELSNKDHKEDPVCECTKLHEKLERLGNEEGLFNYRHMAHSAIERFTPGCPLYFKSHSKKRLELYNMIGEKPPEKVTPEPFNDRQCPTCIFIDHGKHMNTPESFYRDNWINIIETFWNSRMPLQNHCVRCLGIFNHYEIGCSCEKEYWKERIETKKYIESQRLHFNLGNNHQHIQYYQKNLACKHVNCLMNHRSFWKYEIIRFVAGDIGRIMDEGINDTVWNCQLQKIRMGQLKRSLSCLIWDLKLRKYDRNSFFAKTAKVDILLESLKTQWNMFRNRAQDKPQCKCTEIWENNKKMLEKTPHENHDARRKYCELEDKMEQMAKYSLEQDISGCPMDFDHGIVLDSLVVEELKYWPFADFLETFENMDTNFETSESD